MKTSHRLFMDFALRTAKESKAVRLKVGAILVKDGQPLSMGWNGTAPGRNNCCEYIKDGILTTKQEVIHAEMNLVKKCINSGISMNGCTIYLTHSPCLECAKLLSGLGLKTILYLEEYRDLKGVNFLRETGVIVQKFDDKIHI